MRNQNTPEIYIKKEANTTHKSKNNTKNRTKYQNPHQKQKRKICALNKIKVIVAEDRINPMLPDVIFPNWITTHQDGAVILYPMYAKNRRMEKRDDIVSALSNKYNVKKICG